MNNNSKDYMKPDSKLVKQAYETKIFEFTGNE
jgi:hypothetical protein